MISAVVLATVVTVGQLNAALRDARIDVTIAGNGQRVALQCDLVTVSRQLGLTYIDTSQPTRPLEGGLMRAYLRYVEEVRPASVPHAPPFMKKGHRHHHSRHDWSD